MTATVVIVEDHPMYREGLRATLDGDPGLAVVGVAASASDGLAVATETAADVVIVDLGLPDASGLGVVAGVAAARPAAGILVLTSYDDDHHVYAALRAGARGYLVKTASADELLRAVHTVAGGAGTFSASVVDRITRHVVTGGRSSAAGPFPDLSPRERDVLALMAAGHSNAYIADHFVLSLKTVRNHVSTVLAKIGARSRAEAVALARDAGLGAERPA